MAVIIKKGSGSNTGYTDCQGIIAEWINLGHEGIRDDPQMRCYACTGQSSRWYKLVMEEGTMAGDGEVYMQGSGVVGEDWEGPNGQIVHGRKVDYTAKSSQCGVKIHVTGATLHGRNIVALILGG